MALLMQHMYCFQASEPFLLSLSLLPPPPQPKSSVDLDASGPGQSGLLPPPQGHMGWGRGYKSGSFLRVEGEGEASCAAAGNV